MTGADGRKLVGTVGPWSAEKLDLLRCYLGGQERKGGFLQATTHAHHRYYIDLFAGPGQNHVRGTAEVIDGSPLIALKAGPPAFTELFLVDADARNAVSLEVHRQDYPDRAVTVLRGDANVMVDQILATLSRQYPVFAFIDPRGAELDWQTVVKLARHKPSNVPAIELFILFAYNQGLVRLLPHDPQKLVNEAALDRVMPDPRRWREIYAQRRSTTLWDFRRAMLDEYVSGLKSLGYRFVPPPALRGRQRITCVRASAAKQGRRIGRE